MVANVCGVSDQSVLLLALWSRTSVASATRACCHKEKMATSKTCPYCGKSFPGTGVYEHMKYFCKANPKKKSKSYSKKKCIICGRSFSEKHIGVHQLVQHGLPLPSKRKKRLDRSIPQEIPDRKNLERQQMRRKAPSAKTLSKQQASHALQTLQEIRARKHDAESKSRKHRK